jgi:hypothetical protein
MSVPVGIALNNPGGLRWSPAPWAGKVERSKNESIEYRGMPVFEQFASMELGVRAAVVMLRHMWKKGSVDVDSIMNAWFPESDQEQLEAEYITPLCQRLGVQARECLDLTDDEVMLNFAGCLFRLMWGRRPSGGAWVDVDILRRGIWLASQPNPTVAAKGH